MYEIGDRVKIVNHPDASVVGKTGTVTRIREGAPYPVYINVPGGYVGPVMYREIEKIVEDKPVGPNLTREEWDVIHEALLWADNEGAADVWDKVNTWKYEVSN